MNNVGNGILEICNPFKGAVSIECHKQLYTYTYIIYIYIYTYIYHVGMVYTTHKIGDFGDVLWHWVHITTYTKYNV